MLKLPVPESEYITVTTEPSGFQQEMVEELGERAEAIRRREVEPKEDNMLRVTSDGRRLGLKFPSAGRSRQQSQRLYQEHFQRVAKQYRHSRDTVGFL